MARAVSDLERIETELLAYQTALDQHAIVGITDRRGVITRGPTNPSAGSAATRVRNWSARPMPSSIRVFIRKIISSPCGRTIASGGTWRGEICNRAKCGKLYWVDSTIAPIKGDDGQIKGYLAIRIDVTRAQDCRSERAAEIEARTRAETLLRDVIEAIPDGHRRLRRR